MKICHFEPISWEFFEIKFQPIKTLKNIQYVFYSNLELDRDVTIEEVAPILVEKLSKHLNVPIFHKFNF